MANPSSLQGSNVPRFALLFLTMAACNAIADIRDPILDYTLTCHNNTLDGDETDLECGGSCTPCDTGQTCKISGDCQSKICKAGACERPQCDDDVLNGDEGDVDCGGSCPDKCGDDETCGTSDDCASMVCAGGVCQTARCGDGTVQPMLGEECDDGNLVDDRCGESCNRQEVLGISAGVLHSCALLMNGKVKCWGYDYYGQLGLGDTHLHGHAPGQMGDQLPTVNLGTNNSATAISLGNGHSCALLGDGSVKCWGHNKYGQLGLGDTEWRGDNVSEMGDDLPIIALGTGRTASSIASGHNHVCALLNGGNVKCWGHNDYGQLGLGDTLERGTGAGQMGDLLPEVDLGAGKTAVAISAGSTHTCALLSNGIVKCWGGNESGQLGLGDKSVRGDEPGELGDSLVAVPLGAGQTAIAISAGFKHTCALLKNGRVKCWGGNALGQLGLGDTDPRGDEPDEMSDNLAAVDLGLNKAAIALCGGVYHTCAVLDDGSVKCWGYNDNGQLGLGDTNRRGDDPGEMGDKLSSVALGDGNIATAITCQGSHTCALLSDGSTKCWGSNAYGQLGLGDTNDRGDAPGEMGDNLSTVRLFSEVW